MKINRTELINLLAEKLAVSKAQAEKFLNSFIDIVTDSLVEGNEINITGFGAFRKVRRSARKGVNPKTGEKMDIPASNSVNFKAGKTLKEAVK